MQGLESLNQFKNFMSSIGGLGRFEDTYMVHAAEGETVVPMEVLDRNPLLRERLFESMRDMGIEPEQYIVGHNLNSLNPLTGQPEFFLKKIISQIRKAMPGESERFLPALASFIPGVGPLTTAALGAGMGAIADPNWKRGLAQGALLSTGARGLAAGTGTFGAKDFYRPFNYGEGIMGRLSGLGGNIMKNIGAIPEKASDLLSSGYEGAKDLLFGVTGTGDQVKRNKRLVDASLGEGTWDRLGVSGRLNALDKLGIDAKGGGLGGMSLGKLASLFGLGTFIGGKLIGEPEDITIDPSRMRTAPIDTGQIFSPTQPTTVYTDYNVPITQYPYGAAEGGIIGYQGGGLHEDEGFAPDIPGRPYDIPDTELEMWRDFIFKKQKESYDEEKMRRLRELMENPEFKRRIEEKIFGTQTMEARHGGIMDLQGGGFSRGPGTGTSDSIPAMLSDGEFVMTADAVRGAGGGNRREGARRMYETMDRLEARA